jgi:transcriptional regulator with XRE-family HTH domain
MPRPKQEKTIGKALRLLHSGKSQKEVSELCGVSLRTIQRWAREKEADLQALKVQQKVLVQSDPAVLSVVDIRSQVEEILNYRESQSSFALEMGMVVKKATAVILKAVERLEENPEEVNARNLPQLLRAITDAAERTSSAWARAVGLDDLLEQIGNEPKTVDLGSKDDSTAIAAQSSLGG